MENLWYGYRSAPSSYIQNSRTTTDALVADMTQVLCSEHEKKEQMKLTILGVWQEMCHSLFKDMEKLMNSINTLKSLLSQHKFASSPLFLSQVLCTITTLLIEMEAIIPSHDVELADFVCILFDYIEKMKTESNRLLRSTACDCLRELEMTYPGLLSSKVGHFYGMSTAENSYIHQHYKALFATVLDHTVQKFLYEKLQERVPSPPNVDTITDLLSYDRDPLKSFKVPARYKEVAEAILRKKVPHPGSADATQLSEVKKAVSFILDWSHLFTPSCLVSTSLRLISCVQYASLSPKILKRLFQQSPSHDIRLFQLMLLIKLKFGSEICDEVDEANLRKRLLMLCGQATLPDHHRALVWEWLIQWTQATPTELEEEERDNGTVDLRYEVELRRKTLCPSLFDSYELFFCKCKALSLYECSMMLGSDSFGPASVSDMVVNLLKPVRSGATGPPTVTLYRVLYYLYTSHPPHLSPHAREIERLVVDLVLEHPQLVPNTIDFISCIQNSCSKSPLPVNLMSQVTKFLASASLNQLLQHFPLYLMLIKHALAHPQINPVVLLQLLSKTLSGTTLCGEGDWDLGNTLIEICTTTMRVHPTDSVFNDLSTLLQRVAEDYQDLDIRDRAKFYYQLMLTVSADKLSAILTLASDSTTGFSLSDIVEARISNTMFPSACPVRKISDGSGFLSLEPVSNTQDAGAWQGYKLMSERPTPPHDQEEVLKGYLQGLEYSGTGRALIHIQYKISFFKKPPGISNTIYALVLTLSPSKHYHSSPDVYVPFLSVDSHTSAESKVVTFTFRPKDPVPLKFEVSAVFSTEEGVTYSTTLSPITLKFTNLFLPVPASLQEKIPISILFSQLWDHIQSIQQSDMVSGEELGILSTMHLDHRGKGGWMRMTSEALRAFEVPALARVKVTKEEDRPGEEEEEEEEEEEREGEEEVKEEDDSDDAETHRLLLFLAPRYHLLLKFHVKLTSSNVSIATDNWRLLPLVNTFLQGLVSSH